MCMCTLMWLFQRYPGKLDFVRIGKSRPQVPSQEVSFDQKKNNPCVFFSRPPVPLISLSLEQKQLAIFFPTHALYPMKLTIR